MFFGFSLTYMFLIIDIMIFLIIIMIFPEIRYRVMRVSYHPYFIVDSNINIRRFIIRSNAMILGKIIKRNKKSYYFSKNEEHILISKGRIANIYIEGNPKPLNLKDLSNESVLSDDTLYSAINEKITIELSKLHVTKTDMLLLTGIVISIAISGYLFFILNQFIEQYTYDMSLLNNMTKVIVGLQP